MSGRNKVSVLAEQGDRPSSIKHSVILEDKWTYILYKYIEEKIKKNKVLIFFLKATLLLAYENIAGLMRAQGRMALVSKSPELHLEKIILAAV